MSGPLTDLTVVEMAAIGPVPLAGQLLADLGASVIIIDKASATQQSEDINRRGKQSIALNLKNPKGREILLQLISRTDVLLEGFRPGVMEKLGLGPDDCEKINNGLIYGRMTGWGQTGPLSNTAGHDINYLAITGALHAIGKNGEPPVPPLNLVADYAGGTMFLVMGVLAALQERNQSGAGQVIDAAMIEGVPSMMGLVQTLYQQGHWQQTRQSNMLDGGAPYYRCYTTSDDRAIAVGAIEAKFFKEFLHLAGLPESDLSIQNDQDQWPQMHKRYEKHFREKSRDEWKKIFDGSDACVAPVLDFEEAPQHPHNKSRQVFVGDSYQAMPAPKFSRSSESEPASPIAAGSSADELLEKLGYSAEQLKQLKDQGIIT